MATYGSIEMATMLDDSTAGESYKKINDYNVAKAKLIITTTDGSVYEFDSNRTGKNNINDFAIIWESDDEAC